MSILAYIKLVVYQACHEGREDDEADDIGAGSIFERSLEGLAILRKRNKVRASIDLEYREINFKTWPRHGGFVESEI